MITVTLLILLAAFIYDAECLLNYHFERRVIVDCFRRPYLLRWYIFKTKYITLFAHKFVASDEDRANHDHPWSFLVIPVWRGYIEHSERPNRTYDNLPEHNRRVWCSMGGLPHVPVQTRVLPLLGTRYRDTTYRHRVELLNDSAGNPLPAWSIFFHFEKIREWGFWLPEGFMQWNKWHQEKC